MKPLSARWTILMCEYVKLHPGIIINNLVAAGIVTP